jgi:hypothetical protein
MEACKKTRLFTFFFSLSIFYFSSFFFLFSYRQIVGRKKWWFLPVYQTSYLKPSMNLNGFSAHTRTLIGKDGQSPSPWLKKLVRYTITMNPGDVLINPPWFWHGFLNLPASSDSSNTSKNNTCASDIKKKLVIGSAVRYSEKEITKAAMRVNPWWTLNTFVVLFHRYGRGALKEDFSLNLPADIADDPRPPRQQFVMEAKGDSSLPALGNN